MNNAVVPEPLSVPTVDTKPATVLFSVVNELESPLTVVLIVPTVLFNEAIELLLPVTVELRPLTVVVSPFTVLVKLEIVLLVAKFASCVLSDVIAVFKLLKLALRFVTWLIAIGSVA